MSPSTVPGAPVETRVQLELAGKKVELVLDPGGIKPTRLIDISPKSVGHRGEPAFEINVVPSLVDPKIIIAKWPVTGHAIEILLIFNRAGQLLFKSEPCHAGSQPIPIANIEDYIGENAKAVLVTGDPATGAAAGQLERWFKVPKPCASYVWNFEEDTGRNGKWVRRYKKRRIITPEFEALVLFLLTVTFLVILYIGYKRNFHF